jgi:hypothetical protein
VKPPKHSVSSLKPKSLTRRCSTGKTTLPTIKYRVLPTPVQQRMRSILRAVTFLIMPSGIDKNKRKTGISAKSERIFPNSPICEISAAQIKQFPRSLQLASPLQPMRLMPPS